MYYKLVLNSNEREPKMLRPTLKEHLARAVFFITCILSYCQTIKQGRLTD